MDKIKEIAAIIFGSALLVEGKGRTFVKAPMWVVVIAGVLGWRLALLTAVLIVAFGMRAQIVKG